MTRVGAYTPLHLASSRGHAATVTRLLEAGGKVGPFTTTGVQPLHLAAEAGNVEAVKALLIGGADINAKDKTHGRTPLVFAASEDRLDAMKLLLARGADIRLTTTVIDYQARAAADTQARQLRDKIASARTGRVIDSNFNPDPPPPGTVNPGQGVGGGRGAAADPAIPMLAGDRDAVEMVRGRLRTSRRSENRAGSRRCTTRRAMGLPARRSRSSTRAWT